jgi:hypothetical protein
MLRWCRNTIVDMASTVLHYTWRTYGGAALCVSLRHEVHEGTYGGAALCVSLRHEVHEGGGAHADSLVGVVYNAARAVVCVGGAAYQRAPVVGLYIALGPLLWAYTPLRSKPDGAFVDEKALWWLLMLKSASSVSLTAHAPFRWLHSEVSPPSRCAASPPKVHPVDKTWETCFNHTTPTSGLEGLNHINALVVRAQAANFINVIPNRYSVPIAAVLQLAGSYFLLSARKTGSLFAHQVVVKK